MKFKKILANIIGIFIIISIFSNTISAETAKIYSLNINNPPEKPCNINPENGSVDEPINVTLIVCCSDPDGDVMNISFFNAQGDVLIGIHHNVSTGFPGIMTWSNLNYNNTYNWYAVANDSELENKSETWTFTTISYTGENRPPHDPTNPTPTNGSTNISLNPDLSVFVSDPDGDILDVSFYDASDDSLISVDSDVASGGLASVTWSGLIENTSYSWFVIVDDSENTTKSDIWNFTTAENPPNNPPDQPINPSPSSGMTGVDLDPVLSVTVSDPDGDILDVSFYDASDDSLISVDSNVASGGIASVSWSGLNKNTTYRWYVIVDDSEDTTKSITYNFKTINIKLKIDISGGIGVNAFISNIGEDDALNVEWNISIRSIIGFIDETIDGNVDVIKKNDDVIAKKLLVFGFGFVTITAEADCIGADEVIETANAILLGYFILLF